jgi:VanZ family protein
MRATRITALYAPAAALYAGAILWESSLPRPFSGAGPLFQYASNFVHVPMYAALAFLLIRHLASRRADGRISWGDALIVLVTAGVFGMIDEWRQSFVPGRTMAVSDLLLDLTGVVWVLLLHTHHLTRKVTT